MGYQWMSQGKIYVDWDMNPREKDMDHIYALAAHMNEKGFDPKHPVIVYPFEAGNDSYRAATGHHRLEASLLEDEAFPNLPLTQVYVQVCEEGYQHYLRRMLTDNFQHVPGFNDTIGKMPTRSELRLMRQRLLWFPDFFEKGDRLLGREWGCDGKTVSAIRDEIIVELTDAEYSAPEHVPEEDVEALHKIVETDMYIGLDNKKYPRNSNSTSESDEADIKENLLGTWNSKWLPKLRDIFVDLGVSQNSVTANIGRAIKSYYMKIPYEMSGEELSGIISDAITVDMHPRNPDYWHKNSGKDRIDWAFYVMGYASHDWREKLEAKESKGDKSEQVSESPAEKVEKIKELRKDLLALFTLHGTIPIYIPGTNKSTSTHFAEKYEMGDGDAALAIAQLKTTLVNLQSYIQEQLEKNPDISEESLAVAFSEDVSIVKTCMANIETEEAEANDPDADVEILTNLTDSDDPVEEGKITPEYVEEINREYAKIADDMRPSDLPKLSDLDQIKLKVKDQIKTWKKKREDVGHASLTMFVHATLKRHSLPHNTEATVEIYEKLMHLLTTQRSGILEVLVKKQLRGESLWDYNLDEMDLPAVIPADDSVSDDEAVDYVTVNLILCDAKKRHIIRASQNGEQFACGVEITSEMEERCLKVLTAVSKSEFNKKDFDTPLRLLYEGIEELLEGVSVDDSLDVLGAMMGDIIENSKHVKDENNG